MSALAHIDVPPIDIRYRLQDRRFPKGWYCVSDTRDIPESGIMPVSLLNMQMVVYRCADGHIQVADAYCPHLGAHLASSDGCVRNGRVVFPFHKWEFDGATGRLEHIPYTKLVPKASLKLHPTREADGKVMIWFDPNGRDLEGHPYDGAEYLDGDEWALFDTRDWEMTVPFRDILENLFDTAHFTQLHRTEDTPSIRSTERTDYGLRIVFDFAGDGLPLDRMEFSFTGISNVTQYFEGRDPEGRRWKVLAVFSLTPINEQRIWQRVRMFQSSGNPEELVPMIGAAVIGRICDEVEQDLKVLNFKKHLEHPLLCAGDGPINKYRSYSAEFFG